MIDFLGVTKNEFAQKMGYNRSQAIYDITNGKSKPSYDFFDKLLNSEYSEFINIDSLITGKGEFVKTKNKGNVIDSNDNTNDNFFNNKPNIKETLSNEVNEQPIVFRLRTDKTIEIQEVPLYNLEATAGIVSLFADSSMAEVIDTIKIPNLPKCDGALYVTGDSMYPLLKSGDIIMYKKINNIADNIFWGEMYLLSIDNDGDELLTCKYIQKSDRGEEYVRLVSQNQHHQDKDIHISRINALALIKASVRINAMY
ncbi:hypothetical protein BWK60_01435 [Flavobacterium covae]|nr:hypothetical protein BWK60_01435 [Flavobacterium covae]